MTNTSISSPKSPLDDPEPANLLGSTSGGQELKKSQVILSNFIDLKEQQLQKEASKPIEY